MQLAKCVGVLIQQHAAWDAAALLLHQCAHMLPHRGSTPDTQLSAVLSKLDSTVPTHEPPVRLEPRHLHKDSFMAVAGSRLKCCEWPIYLAMLGR